MDFPERLRQKEGDEEQDEAVRPFGLSHGNHHFANMSTNILGLLSAANPKVDYHNRFAGYSSEEDANDSGDETIGIKKEKDAVTDPMAQTMILAKPGSKNRKRSTGHKLMQSVPILSRLSTKRSKKEGKQPELYVQEDSEAESSADENRLAPHMSRILEARAEVEARPSFDLERQSTGKEYDAVEPTGTSPTGLAKRLQEIFGFEESEEVISGQAPRARLQGLNNADITHRISLLPASTRPPPRLHLHHGQTYLLLCVPAQEGCQCSRCEVGEFLTDSILARGHQIRLLVEIGQAESEIQSILVPAKG